MATGLQQDELRQAALRHFSLQLEFEEWKGARDCDWRDNGRWQHGRAAWQRGHRVMCQNCKERFERKRNEAIEKLVAPVMQRAEKNQQAYDTELKQMLGNQLTGQELVALLQETGSRMGA